MDEDSKQYNRYSRFNMNLVHMLLTLATGGLYMLGYMVYYLHKFTKSTDMDKYQYEVEVSKVEKEE